MRRVARSGTPPDPGRRPARFSRRGAERRREPGEPGDPLPVARRVGPGQRGQSRIRPGRQPGGGGRAGGRASVPESRHPGRGRSFYRDPPRLRRASGSRRPRPAPPRLRHSSAGQSKIQNPKSKISSPLAPPDREDQFTFQLRRLPNLFSDARELLLADSLAPNNPARRHSRYADCDRNSPFEVEQAAAAALAIRKSEFKRLQGFDARFVPAWFEDVDLCARLSRAGKLLYWPAAQFRHRGGVSSASLGYSRFLPIYYRNALRYRRLHYGWPARLLYRPLLFAGMLLRLVLLPFRPTVPRPRGDAARAYLATLAVALGLSPTHNSQLTTHNSND